MRLKALALDYDGTIAEHGNMAPEVRAAVGRAREAGLTVIIVTGRILGDLRRVCGDLSFADAIVAENGAVVAFPRSGRSTALHVPPSPAFLDELRKRGVQFETGETVIEADASAAPAALEAIRQLEQPLSLLFNRGRMMILPQAISKASGLASALDALRLSEHNVLAIGDAENDHELLRIAEIGVAVEWGSAALKAVADEVLPGDAPPAVAQYLESLIERTSGTHALTIRRPRRRVTLGVTAGGNELSLAVTGRNVLISGDPRSGKSWVGGLLCEQLILHGYSVCVVDPEGDYASLEALPRVTVVGGGDPPPRPHELLRLLRHPDRSIVIDLSRLSHVDKLEYLRGALPQIAIVRSRTGLPHRVLLDEAHYFLCGEDAMDLLDTSAGGCTLVTYQASRLQCDVLAAADVMLVTRATDPHEVQSLAQATKAEHVDLDEWQRILEGLEVDEAAMLPGARAEESEGRLRRIRLAERLTPHVRHRMKYLDVPVPDRHAFIFRERGRSTGEYAHTLKEFIDVLGRTAPERLHEHIQGGDFSRWIADVFGDRLLAMNIRSLEDNYRLNRIPDINDAMSQAVRSRYEFLDG
jgi:hydroxymethylpyrimidine pyrophosphatase-like HAD family hydrolase